MRANLNGKTARPQLIVGLMSGTSADGIDAVVAEIGRGRRAPDRTGARVVAHINRAFPAELRRQILHVSLHGTVAELCELNFLLGEHFARAAMAVIRKAKLRPHQITAIGSHGQTVHHLPNAGTPSTLQIGEPAVIAELTGITTIADFRVRDIAAGGQGAPLVPFADWALFTDAVRPRIVQNIGGIANLTFLPPRAKLRNVVAFDTGPGNMVIDAVVNQLSQGRMTYDRNGAWAARGEVRPSLLKELLAHSFLSRKPPKTTGREEFGEVFVTRLFKLAKQLKLTTPDIVATTTAFTAVSIANAYERFVFPKFGSAQRKTLQVILGGGGAKNQTLRSMLATELEKRLGSIEIVTHEDFGIQNSAKEALAFALLTHETLAGRPSNVPSATGAGRPVLLGKIVPA
jgi:anhydro-N-acetylmuramic acid kinase